MAARGLESRRLARIARRDVAEPERLTIREREVYFRRLFELFP